MAMHEIAAWHMRCGALYSGEEGEKKGAEPGVKQWRGRGQSREGKKWAVVTRTVLVENTVVFWGIDGGPTLRG
ncbi:hypothetical protein SESBI_41328 [Sesbania bispinosa]|nr:hypothetical protein SESBI_41328 [Sesbania bispinosa]